MPDRLAPPLDFPLVVPGLLRPGRRRRDDALRRAAAGLLDQRHSRRRAASDARGQRRLHVQFPQHVQHRARAGGRRAGIRLVQRPGPTAPVRRLGILFGAAGDHKDAAGNLWLGYPRPRGSLILPLALDVSFSPGGQYVQGNSRFSPAFGAQPPWLFASSAVGVKRCVIPLLGPGDSTARFRVRLALSDPDNAEAGRRVFAVKLQGKTAIARLDVARESGGKNRAMFRDLGPVEVQDKLVLDFVPQGDKPSARQSPILQALEVIRE